VPAESSVLRASSVKDILTSRRVPWLLGLLSCAALSAVQGGAARAKELSAPTSAPAAAFLKPATIAQNQVTQSHINLPVYFEANQGQTDGQVKFLSRGTGYSLFLTATEMVMVLTASIEKATGPRQQALRNALQTVDKAPLNPKTQSASHRSTVLRMTLAGANAAVKLTALDQRPGKSNYFIGKDQAKWLADVPHYARVEYQGIYPGVDMVFYGNRERLEYGFVVAAGADPGMIRLAFAGADKIETDGDGHLLLHTASGKVQLQKPQVYQEIDGVKNLIAGAYVLSPQAERQIGKFASVGFDLGAYDSGQPLVIDPVMEFSTYLGGDRDDRGSGVAVDGAGNIYVTGFTSSSDFPAKNALDSSYNGGGNTDIFVARIDSASNALIYSTYLGGTGNDFASGIGVDMEGNAYVAGDTTSADFPVTNGAYQINRRGDEDVIVAKIGPAGSTLVYSTYLGGSCRNSNSYTESAVGIAVDGAGSAYVTGTTACRDFPTTAGAAQPSYGGGLNDAFAAKLNAAGSALGYSTFLGGGAEESGNGIAIDPQGSAYITGYTASGSFPTTVGAFQTRRPGEGDAFVSKLSADGSHFIYSTFLGGSSGGFIAFDWANAIAVGANGVAYVTGSTSAGNFPVSNAVQPLRRGDWDGFVSAIAPDGSTLVYSTYLGGSGGSGAGSEEGSAIAVDALGNTYVTGRTPSANFPVSADALQSSRRGASDAFISRFAVDGALLYSSYLGGSSHDSGTGVAVEGAGTVVVTGWTESGNFPVVNPLQATKGSAADAFVAKIFLQPAPAQPAVSINDVSVAEGGAGTRDAVFTASLSFAATSTVTVTFTTADNSAVAGIDYAAAAGALIFNPAETTKAITVQVIGDTVIEASETFFVNLISATNATIADGQGVGTIIDDDTIVPVNCAAVSLQSAIDSAVPGQSFAVTGSCDGNIVIRNEAQRITLDGGGSAVIQAFNLDSPSIMVRGKGILIQGFTIIGGSDGVHVNRGSNAVLDNNIIQSANGNGVVVDELSFAVLTNNTIQNNPGAGLFVSENSTARIGFNQDSEIVASANTITSNGVGVLVSNNSSARMIGNTVQNNAGAGIQVLRDSHADIASNAISGNGGDGIEVAEDSTVQLGEDSGTAIFESANTSTSTNAGFGVRCTNGGAADGRLGSLTGNAGVKNFTAATCLDSLSP